MILYSLIFHHYKVKNKLYFIKIKNEKGIFLERNIYFCYFYLFLLLDLKRLIVSSFGRKKTFEIRNFMKNNKKKLVFNLGYFSRSV